MNIDCYGMFKDGWVVVTHCSDHQKFILKASPAIDILNLSTLISTNFHSFFYRRGRTSHGSSKILELILV